MHSSGSRAAEPSCSRIGALLGVRYATAGAAAPAGRDGRAGTPSGARRYALGWLPRLIERLREAAVGAAPGGSKRSPTRCALHSQPPRRSSAGHRFDYETLLAAWAEAADDGAA